MMEEGRAGAAEEAREALEANRALQSRMEELVARVDVCAARCRQRRRKMLANIAMEGTAWRPKYGWTKRLEFFTEAIKSKEYQDSLPEPALPSLVEEIFDSSAPWGEEEGAYLCEIVPGGVSYQSLNWDEIAKQFNGRDPSQGGKSRVTRSADDCRLAWKNLWGPHVYKGQWTKEEDEKLRNLVQLNSERNWEGTASGLGTGRTAYQCLERYQRHLSPALTFQPWKPQEDEALLHAIEVHGMKNWTFVATMVPGRTGRDCQLRYNKRVRADMRKGRWTKEEEYRLMLSATACMRLRDGKSAAEGDVKRRNWLDIARYVPTRNDVQCREKWTNSLDPELNHDPWTEEEDELLKSLIDKHGQKWKVVAPLLKDRTQKQAKLRWAEIRGRGNRKRRRKDAT